MRLPLRTLLALLGTVAALTGCVTRAADFEPLEIMGWAEAGAVKDGNGQWACYASTPYGSGITLEVWRTVNGYRLDFEKSEWSLEADTAYPVIISIDDLWRAPLHGLVDEEGIRVPLGLDAEALGALRRGSMLILEAEAQTFRFELENEATMLDRLESCYRRHLPKDASGYQNPFASAQNPFKVQPHRVPTLSPTTVVTPATLEEILRKATALDFRANHATEFTPTANLVYVLDGYIFGYFWEIALEEHNLDTAMSLTLASMQNDCIGRAVSGRYPGRENDIARLRRGFVTCEADDFFADILILASGSFAMVFVTSSSLEDAELAETVGAAVGGSFVP